MIVGLDHLALNCSDFSEALEILEAAGYTALFVEKEIPNAPEKRSFLSQYHPSHSIAYMQSSNNHGPFIEITQHSQHSTAASGYKVLKSSWDVAISENQLASSSLLQAALLGDAEPGLSTYLSDKVAAKFGGELGGAIVVAWASEVATSLSFWIDALNFREVVFSEEGEPFYMLKMSSPLPGRSLFLIILSTTSPQQCTLDELGCSCLCFATTDLCRDREALISSNYIASYSDPFLQEVNDKNTLIELYRTTQGQLIELVQYGAQASTLKE